MDIENKAVSAAWVLNQLAGVYPGAHDYMRERLKEQLNEEDERTVARLNDLLDARDKELEEARERNQELERRLAMDPVLWALPGEAEDARADLPLPRLELLYTPSGELGWRDYTVTYRLLYRHFLGYTAQAALGQTRTRGGRGAPPFKRRTVKTPKVWQVELPVRDGVHIRSDMAALRLPGFAVCGDQVDDLSELAGNPGER